MSVTTPNIAESRRLLVFVNPNSGPGVALKTFNTRIRSFLGEANISYDLIVTTHVGHCQQIIQDSKDLSKYTGIVAVSGDGLLYEVSLHYIIDHNMIKNKQPIYVLFK
jgi:sphingosine kinase